jgi:uncharacterized RDD family membrane protein YckC
MQSQTPYQAATAAPVLHYVGVGRRFLATLLDVIILSIVDGIISALFLAGSFTKGATISNMMTFGNNTYHASSLGDVLLILVPCLYFIALEATLGATLGKMILGIRVVKVDGSPMSAGASLIRNLLRIIDVLPIAYLVGAIFIWTSSTKQRLGDRVAHTVVVRRS